MAPSLTPLRGPSLSVGCFLPRRLHHGSSCLETKHWYIAKAFFELPSVFVLNPLPFPFPSALASFSPCLPEKLRSWVFFWCFLPSPFLENPPSLQDQSALLAPSDSRSSFAAIIKCIFVATFSPPQRTTLYPGPARFPPSQPVATCGPPFLS